MKDRNKENLFRLFDEAESRIIEAEKKEEQQKQEKRLRIQKEAEEEERKRKLKTESIALSIITLISDVLSNAKTRKGNITLVDENLGRLSDARDDKSYSSYYSLEDSVLTICLNYSNGYMDRDHYGYGECFLGKYKKSYDTTTDDNGVDYAYLQDILSQYNIDIERQQQQHSPSMEYREDDIVIIKVNRKQKEITQPKK